MMYSLEAGSAKRNMQPSKALLGSSRCGMDWRKGLVRTRGFARVGLDNSKGEDMT